MSNNDQIKVCKPVAGPLEKLQFISMMAEDQNLSSIQIRTGIIITNLYNQKIGYAWPSHQYISNKINASKRSVINAIEKLCEQGWFDVKKTRGRGKTNQYIPIFRQPKNKCKAVDHSVDNYEKEVKFEARKYVKINQKMCNRLHSIQLK